MRRMYAVLALAVVIALPLAGCGGDDDGGGSSASKDQQKPSGPTVDLTAKDFEFDPTALTSEAGREVTIVLTNDGDTEHNITIEDLDVDKDAEPGETGQAKITPDAGSYDFHCKYHPNQMTGTLTVE